MKMKKCPHCSEEILYSAKVCCYCHKKTEKSKVFENSIILEILIKVTVFSFSIYLSLSNIQIYLILHQPTYLKAYLGQLMKSDIGLEV